MNISEQKGGASPSVDKWRNTEQTLPRISNPRCGSRNEHWREFIIFLPHQIFSNHLAHSEQRRASKSNDYMAKITMWPEQLYTVSPGRLLRSGWWLCVLHWSEDFQRSQRWGGNLGQYKEMDILSRSSYWESVLVWNVTWWCQTERKCLGHIGVKHTTDISQRLPMLKWSCQCNSTTDYTYELVKHHQNVACDGRMAADFVW